MILSFTIDYRLTIGHVFFVSFFRFELYANIMFIDDSVISLQTLIIIVGWLVSCKPSIGSLSFSILALTSTTSILKLTLIIVKIPDLYALWRNYML